MDLYLGLSDGLYMLGPGGGTKVWPCWSECVTPGGGFNTLVLAARK